MVSEKYSIASKKKWAKIPLAQRKKIMSERAKQRWAGMSLDEKARHIRKMVAARKKKKAE